MPRMLVFSDGGARGNPGPAGAGAVVTDPAGNVLRELCLPLGRTTNNVAEYQGALIGLRAALEEGADEVELYADSELLIRQLRGEYRVKAPHLRPLYLEAKTLLARFRTARLTHVRREQNRDADRLANQAMDSAIP